jgi:hypothetical protein
MELAVCDALTDHPGDLQRGFPIADQLRLPLALMTNTHQAPFQNRTLTPMIPQTLAQTVHHVINEYAHRCCCGLHAELTHPLIEFSTVDQNLSANAIPTSA